MMHSLPAHGRFRIARFDRVICLRAFDEWNEQATIDFVESFRAIATSLSGQPWGVLNDLRSWELGVPEMEPLMYELDLWCVEAGQTIEGAILPDNPLVLMQLQEMFAGSEKNIERDYFQTPAAALDWFGRKGFPISVEEASDFFSASL